jgi:hypothetical protein
VRGRANTDAAVRSVPPNRYELTALMGTIYRRLLATSRFREGSRRFSGGRGASARASGYARRSPTRRAGRDIEVLPWRTFVARLWAGDLAV